MPLKTSLTLCLLIEGTKKVVISCKIAIEKKKSSVLCNAYCIKQIKSKSVQLHPLINRAGLLSFVRK